MSTPCQSRVLKALSPKATEHRFEREQKLVVFLLTCQRNVQKATVERQAVYTKKVFADCQRLGKHDDARNKGVRFVKQHMRYVRQCRLIIKLYSVSPNASYTIPALGGAPRTHCPFKHNNNNHLIVRARYLYTVNEFH